MSAGHQLLLRSLLIVCGEACTVLVECTFPVNEIVASHRCPVYEPVSASDAQ
jgi:hypothetical protein